METAICDTSALSRLYKGNVLDCLGNIFHKVYIPKAVNEECRNSRNSGIANAVRKYFFETVSVNKVLDIGLGKGEREAISLAKERNIKTILLDDHKAIKRPPSDWIWHRLARQIFC